MLPTITFPIDQVFYKQLTLAGSICYTARTWDRMITILAQGRIRLGDLVSAKLPLSEWRQAFDLCVRKKALKVILYPEFSNAIRHRRALTSGDEVV